MEDVYSYLYTDSQDEVKPLKLFEGKVLLIFNFALHSSFLSSYVSNIEIAYRAMADLGFEVLSFPSSSFPWPCSRYAFSFCGYSCGAFCCS